MQETEAADTDLSLSYFFCTYDTDLSSDKRQQLPFAPSIKLFHSLFLLLLFQCSPLLHKITVETWLFSLLLLQVDAGDESSPIQLNMMLFFVTESHIKYTLFTCSSVFIIIVTQNFHTDSHRVVVNWSVFRSIPLKHKLPVVEVTSPLAFFNAAQVTLL